MILPPGEMTRAFMRANLRAGRRAAPATTRTDALVYGQTPGPG